MPVSPLPNPPSSFSWRRSFFHTLSQSRFNSVPSPACSGCFFLKSPSLRALFPLGFFPLYVSVFRYSAPVKHFSSFERGARLVQPCFVSFLSITDECNKDAKSFSLAQVLVSQRESVPIYVHHFRPRRCFPPSAGKIVLAESSPISLLFLAASGPLPLLQDLLFLSGVLFFERSLHFL